MQHIQTTFLMLLRILAKWIFKLMQMRTLLK